MRPFNLIPPEEQGPNADRGPLRTGPAPYIIVAALALGLVLVLAMTVTSKQITDRQDEVDNLNGELAAATQRADGLRAFQTFREVQEARTQTVSSLAQSRFDWERVLRELSLVIPPEIWLVKMTGTVSPTVAIEGGAEVAIRDSIAGPALEIVGCGPSQDAVAGWVAALEDIDGVTRVGLEESAGPEGDASTSSSSAPETGEGTPVEDCRTRNFIYQFKIAVAFDEVPAPPTATAPPAVPATGAPTTSPGGQLAQTPPTTDTNSAAEQTGEAQEATNLVPGG